MKKLITIAVLTFASAGFGRAAKLCKMTLPPAAPYDEMAKNLGDWSWAYGKGCGTPTGSYSGTGVPSGYCDEVKLAGLASCFSYHESVTNYNYYGTNGTWIQPEDRGLQGQDAKAKMVCYCKITYPFVTPWRISFVYVSQTACENYCVPYCKSALEVM